MTNVIKGLRAKLARPWLPQDVVDLTQAGAGVTPEERAALGLAAGVIAGKVVNLDAYRERHRCESCGRVLRKEEGKVCRRCEARAAVMVMREEEPRWE